MHIPRKRLLFIPLHPAVDVWRDSMKRSEQGIATVFMRSVLLPNIAETIKIYSGPESLIIAI
jgi:hypothetical protein